MSCVSSMMKLGVVGLLGMIAWFAYVQWLIHTTQERELSQQSEVGIILGAALWNNVPSPALKERLEHGIELYKNNKVNKLIVSGGEDQNGSTISEAEGMKNYLIDRGIPSTDLFIEDQSTSTYENLLFSQKVMKRQDWEDAVIITHSYHGARAYDMARFIGLKKPEVSTTDSKVMWMPWHKARETLAYSKWQLDKLLMITGIKPK